MIGTAAMVWVGGGILVHGMEGYGLPAVAHAIHQAGEVAAGALPSAMVQSLGRLVRLDQGWLAC
ncbi:DUF808 family protein [Micromonospora sp. STR1s_5]|nr:DUF808 family protein [Micromonospora sp. STR1s_5]